MYGLSLKWVVCVGVTLICACKDPKAGPTSGAGGGGDEPDEMAQGGHDQVSASAAAGAGAGAGAGPTLGSGFGVTRVAGVFGPIDLAIDAEGNRLFTTTIGEKAVFKVAPSGAPLWTAQLPALSAEYQPSTLRFQYIAAGEAGAAFVAGTTDGLLPGESKAEVVRFKDDVVVGRFEADGSPTWFHQFGGVGNGEAVNSVPVGIAVGVDGDVFVSGASQGLIEGQLDDGHDADYALQGGAFVARYAPDGTQRWLTQFNENDNIAGLALDAAGNAYVAGAGFGADQGSLTFYVSKVDSDGRWLWTKEMVTEAAHTGPDSRSMNIRSVAVSDDGSVIYLGGDAPVDFGQPNWPKRRAGTALFVLRLDEAATPVWGRMLLQNAAEPDKCTDDDTCFDPAIGTELVTTRDGESVYLAAASTSRTPPPKTIPGRNILLFKLDAAGEVLWKQAYAAKDPNGAYVPSGDLVGLALDPNLSPTLMGVTNGSFPGESAAAAAAGGTLFFATIRPEDGELH